MTVTLEDPAIVRLSVPSGTACTAEPHSDLTPEELAAVDEALAAGKPCPVCERHRDPVTGELRFNAKVTAGFAEADAILRGEIPARRFDSIEEMWAALEEEMDEDDG